MNVLETWIVSHPALLRDYSTVYSTLFRGTYECLLAALCPILSWFLWRQNKRYVAPQNVPAPPQWAMNCFFLGWLVATPALAIEGIETFCGTRKAETTYATPTEWIEFFLMLVALSLMVISTTVVLKAALKQARLSKLHPAS